MRHAGVENIRASLASLGIPPDVLAAIMNLILYHADPTRLGATETTCATTPVGLRNVGSIARQFHRHSLRRGELLGLTVQDPAWNMMLALVADALAGKISSVTSLCHGSGVPQTTALRHLAALEHTGLVRRRDDPRDARRIIIEATPGTIEMMSDVIIGFCVDPPAD